jgi:TRAP-type mannitol/chloroaromatic compound transport system permease small subunit
MLPLLIQLSTLIDRATGGLGRLVRWLTLAMVVVAASNAVLRHLGKFVGTNLTSNASIETQWYLFSVVFLLGAATTLQQDGHVRVDVLYGNLGIKARAAIDLVGTLTLLLPFCAFALWVTNPSVRASIAVWEVSPDPGGLPRWPIKAMVLVCFALLAVQGVSEGIKRIAILAGPAPSGGET